ncbi:MAG: hypothetical protein U9Q98_09890 [Bacteroidota bacterium]|nr:hypothetical protein [Bacteroidota bacterium]
MKTGAFNLYLDFRQILDLVRQLPINEKIKLTRELEKEVKGNKLAELLTAFQTDELSEETINEEVEAVRKGIYKKKKTD